MSAVEKIIFAVLSGTVSGAAVYGVSDALNAARLWPGTLLAFGSAAMATLVFLNRRGRR